MFPFQSPDPVIQNMTNLLRAISFLMNNAFKGKKKQNVERQLDPWDFKPEIWQIPTSHFNCFQLFRI